LPTLEERADLYVLILAQQIAEVAHHASEA